MLLMVTPANLVLLPLPSPATISSMFIMRAPILLLIACTTMDHMQFTFTSTITGVIIQTESSMIPTVPQLPITMLLSMLDTTHLQVSGTSEIPGHHLGEKMVTSE